MDESEFLEKRKYPRAPVEVEIHSSELPEDQQKGKGLLCFFSKNISVGGIFLETTMPLEIGSVIYMRFNLPSSPTPIITQAIIVRINKKGTDLTPGMGIEFRHLSYADKTTIDEYVKRNGDK